MPRVLHILSQRPQLTGSGITLEAFVAGAKARGWQQAAVIGIPAGTEAAVDGLTADELHPIVFESDDLPFPVPGMSDTMPYKSSRWSALSEEQLAAYRRVVGERIALAIEAHRPDVIHSNHLWIATGIVRQLAGSIPVVVHSHGTGLRQLDLCPHLADDVLDGVRGCRAYFALHEAHRRDISARVGVELDAVVRVGAGYRADIFKPGGDRASRNAIAYAGKLARAKGVPWMIGAVDWLSSRHDLTLSLAGGGENDDARAVRELAGKSKVTTLFGRLDQRELAALLADSDVFVLPSMYEGLPLVLVEAFASGCRLVATDLPGVRELAPALGDRLEIVPMPRLIGPDEPHPDDLGQFEADLGAAIERALEAGRPPQPSSEMLAALSWDSVFERVESVWRSVLETG